MWNIIYTLKTPTLQHSNLSESTALREMSGEGNGTPLQYSCLENPMNPEEPGRLQSMGSWRVGHDWATSLSLFTFMHWRRKWQPIPVFLPGKSQGQQSLVGSCPWGRVAHDWSDLAAAAAAAAEKCLMNVLLSTLIKVECIKIQKLNLRIRLVTQKSSLFAKSTLSSNSVPAPPNNTHTHTHTHTQMHTLHTCNCMPFFHPWMLFMFTLMNILFILLWEWAIVHCWFSHKLSLHFFFWDSQVINNCLLFLLGLPWWQ